MRGLLTRVFSSFYFSGQDTAKKIFIVEKAFKNGRLFVFGNKNSRFIAIVIAIIADLQTIN